MDYCWSIAIIDLGIDDALFWRLTYEEFKILHRRQVERFNDDMKWQDLSIARIEALLANINRDTKQRRKPFSVHDFMVTHQKKPPEQQSTDQMLKQVEFLTQFFGGADERQGES